MLTYILFKTQSMILSATPRKGQPYAVLHPVQNQEHALISNNEEGLTRQMLTYKLLKTENMLSSGTCRNSQLDADLQAPQNPDHAPVSNNQEEPARC